MKNQVRIIGFMVLIILMGACSSSGVITKTEMTQKNYRKSKAKQAPINSLHYAKRYWKPKYKRESLLSFLSKKSVKKPKPKPEYTHE